MLPYLVEQKTPLGRWTCGLLARAHKNVVVVALANKLARIAWVVLARGGVYNTGYEAVAAECKDCLGVPSRRRVSEVCVK